MKINNLWLYLLFLFALLFAYDASTKEMYNMQVDTVCIKGVQYYHYSTAHHTWTTTVVDAATLKFKRCKLKKPKCKTGRLGGITWYSDCKWVDVKEPKGK